VPEGTTICLLGFYPNQPWRVREWGRTVYEMNRMLHWLDRHPDAGLLWHQILLGRYPTVITYWESAAALHGFAASAQAPHVPGWRWATRLLARTDAVGMWHETYVVGEHDSIYLSMPPVGLGAAFGTVPITGASASWAKRLAGSRAR
jgi:hypothetical protein